MLVLKCNIAVDGQWDLFWANKNEEFPTKAPKHQNKLTNTPTAWKGVQKQHQSKTNTYVAHAVSHNPRANILLTSQVFALRTN